MGQKVVYRFEAINNFTGVADKIKRSSEKLKTSLQHLGRGMAKLRTKAIQLSTTLRTSLARGIGRANEKFKDFLKWGTLAIGGVAALALKRSMDMEVLGLSFEVMLKSADKAKKLMVDLRTFAAQTPFKMEGVAQAGKVMLGFGFELDTIMPRLKMLGNISAGSGKNIKDLTVIFGQVKAKGRLMGEEMLQFAEAGIPIQETLIELLGVKSPEAFRKMGESGKLKFADLERAFMKLTTAGGLYDGMTKRLAETTAGRFTTLTDTTLDKLQAIGDELIKTYEMNLGIKNLSEAIRTLPDEKLKSLVKDLKIVTDALMMAVNLMGTVLKGLKIMGTFAGEAAAQLAISPSSINPKEMLAKFIYGIATGQSATQILGLNPAHSNLESVISSGGGLLDHAPSILSQPKAAEHNINVSVKATAGTEAQVEHKVARRNKFVNVGANMM